MGSCDPVESHGWGASGCDGKLRSHCNAGGTWYNFNNGVIMYSMENKQLSPKKGGGKCYLAL